MNDDLYDFNIQKQENCIFPLIIHLSIKLRRWHTHLSLDRRMSSLIITLIIFACSFLPSNFLFNHHPSCTLDRLLQSSVLFIWHK